MNNFLFRSFLAIGFLCVIAGRSSATSIQNFEAGTISPGSTSLTLSACIPDISEGKYAIGSIAYGCHNNWAPTMAQSGNNFLIANGSTAVGDVYTQTVTVIANTNNTFSAWTTGLYSTGAAVLELRIYDGIGVLGTLLNSTQFTTNLAAPGTGGGLAAAVWEQFSVTALTTSNTITLQVFNTNINAIGNDFGLDSLELSQNTNPEPATFFLAGSALLCLMVLRRKIA